MRESRASKIFGGKKREQNRARGRNNRDHIDQVSRGHQQRRRGIGRRLVGLRLLALGPLWRCLRAHCIPREASGSGALGGLTQTLSLSRFVPDLGATIACRRTRKLKGSGKPKLTQADGL